MSRDERWLMFLARWCLITAALGLGLTTMFFVAAAFDVPMDQAELIGAVRRPFAHRLQATFDSAVWIAIGGVLVGFAGLLATRAPIRSTLISACGIGQLIGCSGGFIRFYVVDDVASRFSHAAMAEQAQLLQSYHDLSNVFGSLFATGALLYGIGFMLVGSILYRTPGFSRWLTVWIALSGVYPVTQQLLAIGGVDLRNAFAIYFLLGHVALYIALGVYLWRHPKVISIA